MWVIPVEVVTGGSELGIFTPVQELSDGMGTISIQGIQRCKSRSVDKVKTNDFAKRTNNGEVSTSN